MSLSDSADGMALIQLADYRRRVADLYTEVRATPDHEAAWQLWRRGRDDLFGTHPQSPLQIADRVGFSGFEYYPYDPDLCFEVPVSPLPTARPQHLEHSGTGTTAAQPIGVVSLPLIGDPELTISWLDGYGGGLFLAFQDATGGVETYGGGRYLIDTVKGADLGAVRTGELMLDFNFAYHPSCVHSPEWSCPLPPPGNRLEVPIRGGERLA